MQTALPLPASVIRELYGHDLCEYQLVMRPAAGVAEKIMAGQQWYYEEYKKPSFSGTAPQIVIASFFAKETMEATLVRWIERICGQQRGFEVVLNHYGGLPAHTIYLRILNEQPFAELVTGLRVVDTYIRSCACPPVSFVSKPYLVVLAGLEEASFTKVLARYARESFHESFAVNEVQLLRRKHTYEPVRPVYVFGLQPYEHTAPFYQS